MPDRLRLVFHHGGAFETDPRGNFIYTSDLYDEWVGVDEDYLDVFAVTGYYKELGYDKAEACWYLEPKHVLEFGLRRLKVDQDLVDMIKHCHENNNVIHIYFEHGTSIPEIIDVMNLSEEDGLPCRHAIAAISVMNGRPENYVHAWLTMGSYNKIYEYHINPVRSQQLWETSEYLHCLPPVRSKPRGRPSHYARKKDQHEAPVRGSQERTATKLKRKYGKFTCGTCGDVGHTTRSCRISKKQKVDELAAAAKAAEDAADKGDTGSKGNKGEVVTEECEVGAEGGQIDTQTEVAAEGGLGAEQEPATKAVKTTKTAKKGHLRTKCERRIDKLPVKRTTSSTAATAAAAPNPTEISRETIQGASAATSEKLASFLKFVPNPGFNPPRKTV
ncbi:hypothetical protein Ahy_B04g073382 [Arachis hypogaea]|uniref:PB1-like domain-containing protein n=1 Tax=Arachis hypogaea TaxID=3818 RepID=A0A444ZQ98_ARAHY|nr:hypothetical protein Ahy_B04g073382 [Arachis hypogaea]